MADRKLIVQIVGDSSSLERALNRSKTAASSFGATMTNEFGHPVGGARAELDAMAASIRRTVAESNEFQARTAAAAGATRDFSSGADGAARSARGLASSYGPAAAATFVVFQALNEASKALRVTGSEAGTTQGRIRNLGAELLQGNIVGGIAALRRGIELSDESMQNLVSSSASAGNQIEIDGLKALAAATGMGKYAEQLDEVSRAATAAAAARALFNEQAAVGAAAARTGLPTDVAGAAAFGERGDLRFGRGPGAIAESNARQTGGTLPAPITGLSQRLQTAIALAQAGGNVKNEVAQLRRGAEFLEKALKQAGLDDAGKEQLATSLAGINSQIETLLKPGPKKPKGPEAPIVPFALESSVEAAKLTKGISDDLAALREVDHWLTRKIAGEKDANRKLRELQELGRVRADIAATTGDPAATLLGRLNLNVAKAGLTKTPTDDLAANAKLVAELRKQVSLHKDDLDLANQLVSAEQARNTLIEQRNNARQFRTLGLGPTGQALVPLKSGLARQLKQVTDNVAGSFLDTPKTQKVLAAIRKLVLNPFTKVSAEVRATIKGMLDDIAAQLKDHGPLTKTTSLASAGNLFGGLGLDRETQKRLQARLSGFNSAGVRVAGASVAGPSVPGVSGFGGFNVVLHHETKLDGRVLEHSTTKYQQRRVRQNPSTRRGRR